MDRPCATLTYAECLVDLPLQGIYMLELSRDGQILAVCTGNELVLYDMYTLLSTEKQEAGCHLRMPNESQALHVQWGPSGTVAETQLLVVTSNGDLLRGEVFEGEQDIAQTSRQESAVFACPDQTCLLGVHATMIAAYLKMFLPSMSMASSSITHIPLQQAQALWSRDVVPNPATKVVLILA